MSRGRLALAVLAIVLYVSASVRLGNVYPFAAFDMFAGRWDEAHQVLATPVAGGPARGLEAFSGWKCDYVSRQRGHAASGGLPWCVPGAGHPEYEPKALARLRTAQVETPPAGAMQVAVVRRTWRKRDAAKATRSDCQLLACVAVDAGGNP